jgi:hypothetical protein
MEMPASVLAWLLEDADPSVKYRALTELLGDDKDHAEVVEARDRIPKTKAVVKVLSDIQSDGEWPWTGSYDSPELGISYLGELGLSRSHPTVSRAVEAFLSKQYSDGCFPNSYTMREGAGSAQRNDQSCYYALTIRGLIQLGYADDERVKKALTFTLSEARWDGGYLCSKSYVRAGTKSCIRGSKNVLLLFAELPELWGTPACKGLVDYFLDRKVFYHRSDHTRFVSGHPQTFFPLHYRFGVLEPLYALSKMGYGNHAAVAEAWGFLDEKRDASGRFILDWTMPKCSFNPGKKGLANKWVTLYALLAMKHRNDSQPLEGAA